MLDTSTVVICSAMIIMLIRDWSVYRSSIWMIDNRYDLFRKMPSFDAMMINPIHWKRWTGKQWEAWLLKEESNA